MNYLWYYAKRLVFLWKLYWISNLIWIKTWSFSLLSNKKLKFTFQHCVYMQNLYRNHYPLFFCCSNFPINDWRCWTSCDFGLQACNFIKKRLRHRSFTLNSAKFLRTLFLPYTSGRLLLFHKPLLEYIDKT